jgi:ubiquinone/menaquinone biosynthesis C-methylase UbiE
VKPVADFRDRFDAEEWSAVYESEKKDAKSFVFYHGAELVQNACLRQSRRGELWIDVGCGTGHVAANLCDRGLLVTGIDHDPNMVAFANRRFPALKFLTASADHLPFDNKSVDGVLATSVMGCLACPESFYQEAHRVLRHSGTMVLTFTNQSSWLLRMSGRLPATEKYHLYNSSEIAKDLRRHGFEVLQLCYYNFFLNFSNKTIPPVSLALGAECLGRFNWSRFLGRNFFVVAQKCGEPIVAAYLPTLP